MLSIAQEAGYRSVAVPALYSSEKNFPLEENAHIVLRTIRRNLPRLTNVGAVVIYCASQEQYEVFYNLLQCYFPRSWQEAALQKAFALEAL